MDRHRDCQDGPTHDSGVDISVVIACFNEEATLGTQLDALVQQVGAPRFEVIVADNGSTDASTAVADAYADRLDLRVVDASGVRGPGHARNVGVAAARSDLIAFCDADDEVAGSWVAQAHAALVGGHAFVAGRVDVDKLNSRAVRRSRRMAQQAGLQECGGELGLVNAGAGNMALRREAFERVGGFDETLMCLEDSDLCWRMQLAGTPLDYVPDMVISTRLRHTWSGMVQQGYLYGRSFAQLEQRYGLVAASTRAGAPRRRGSARVVDLVCKARQMGFGGVLWHAAWKLGYMTGRQDDQPVADAIARGLEHQAS